jgi:hypothetical protein
MSAIRLAVTAVGVVITIAQHPVVRAGIRAVAANPRAREIARETVLGAAYTAGVVARRVIPRTFVR